MCVVWRVWCGGWERYLRALGGVKPLPYRPPVVPVCMLFDGNDRLDVCRRALRAVVHLSEGAAFLP